MPVPTGVHADAFPKAIAPMASVNGRPQLGDGLTVGCRVAGEKICARFTFLSRHNLRHMVSKVCHAARYWYFTAIRSAVPACDLFSMAQRLRESVFAAVFSWENRQSETDSRSRLLLLIQFDGGSSGPPSSFAPRRRQRIAAARLPSRHDRTWHP